MLKRRVVSSLILFLILWLVIFILPVWSCMLTVVVLIGLGLNEFFNMARKKGIPIYKYFGIVIGCLIPITTYLRLRLTTEIEFIVITAVCLAVFLLQFTRRKTDQALIGIATTVFGIFYISWFFSFMVKLRMVPPAGLDGRFLILYLLIVTKSGDIAAYFIGTAFGKHQLIPRISPKKSVEGAIAGVITSFITAIIFRSFIPSIELIHIFILGIFLSVLSQIGDLSESLIKRDCHVQDSGLFFPGLGGVLDSLDSLLFATPIFYFYLKLIS